MLNIKPLALNMAVRAAREVLNPGNYRMIAVSGVIYRIFANELKETDWCVKKGKIPDTQFGFFPGRSTLHPLFILRHLRHAAKKRAEAQEQS